MSGSFRPWRTDWAYGGGFLVTATSAGIFAISLGQHRLSPYAISIAVVFGFASLFFLRRGLVRAHGNSVECKALKQLDKLLKPGWELQRNVMLKSGDLDGLIVGPEDIKHALEIKSQSSIRILKGGMFGKDRLVERDGRAYDTKALKQALRNAIEVDGIAVLWYPQARERGVSKDILEVIVVCGPPRDLLRALGVPRKGFW